MKIKVSFLDKENKEIKNNDGSSPSFNADLNTYMNRTEKLFPWDKIKSLLDNGISYQSEYVLGSSVLIEEIL